MMMYKMSIIMRTFLSFICVLILCSSSLLLAESPRVIKLEQIELSGTSRLTKDQIASELGLKKGTILNDNLVAERGRSY